MIPASVTQTESSWKVIAVGKFEPVATAVMVYPGGTTPLDGAAAGVAIAPTAAENRIQNGADVSRHLLSSIQ